MVMGLRWASNEDLQASLHRWWWYIDLAVADLERLALAPSAPSCRVLIDRHRSMVMQGCLAPQVFEKHCVNAWDDDRNAWRSCFSDEHYFATVLATQGVDEVSSPQASIQHDLH